MALDAYSTYTLIALYAASIPIQAHAIYTWHTARKDLDAATEDWKVAGDNFELIANNFKAIHNIIKEQNKNLTGIIKKYEKENDI